LKKINGKTEIDTKYPDIGVMPMPQPFNVFLRNFALVSSGKGIVLK
jgi:hypothetical protein